MFFSQVVSAAFVAIIGAAFLWRTVASAVIQRGYGPRTEIHIRSPRISFSVGERRKGDDQQSTERGGQGEGKKEGKGDGGCGCGG